MTAEEVNYYEACDRAIRAMNRDNLDAFGRLKMAKWDKIRIIQTVVEVYQKSAKRARKRYYEEAFEAYLLGLLLCNIDSREAHRMAENGINMGWVDDILDSSDFVTHYRFNTEMERKAYRLAEALEVSEDRDSEVNKALRSWSKQLGQYAVNITDYAMIQAFQDVGIERVMWVTMRDERVCSECVELNGHTYSINEIPPKPHWGCRCRLQPIMD